MTYLSHLYLPGALALWSALFFALASVWGYSLVLRGDPTSLVFARRSYNFFALSIVLTSGVLLLLLGLRDFRIEYVSQYSGNDLAGHFQLAAFWAGQKGSFLIWLLWGSLLGVGIKRAAGKSEPAVMMVYLLTVLGLLLILVRENPFVMLAQTPLDGAGLNPLLQNNWMVIHPPIMFVGYAASAIPFAFAMAALWRRDYDSWAARAFPWALGGFLILGTAILMGGYWAYETLGWGGYWGWDPVENASLIPWLFGTVMIHGLYMERTKKRYRRANYVFAALTYLSVLYGTFLTRSGVLADFSVHSFVDLGISGLLLFGMGTFVVISIYLLATRLREVPTEKLEDPLLSRGTFLVLGSITILASAVVITIGTSAPILTRFMKNPGQVGPSFYNQVNLPIAFLIAFLLALVPYLTWKGQRPEDIPLEKPVVPPGRSSLRSLLRALVPFTAWQGVGREPMWRKILVPLYFAVAATVGAGIWKIHHPFHLAFVFLGSLALASNFQKVVQKIQGPGGLRGAGGYLAHVGVGIILLGILASSGYDESTKVTLEQGKPTVVGDMTITFDRFEPRTAERRERMRVTVEKANGEKYIAYPRLFVNDRTKQLMANPDVQTTLLRDFYISPIDYDPGQPHLELAKGKSGKIGDMEIRFVSFDMQAQGNAMAQMQAGKEVTIGANLEVSQGNGPAQPMKALYRLNPADGRVETPPLALPGGGRMMLAGINASSGAIQLETQGVASRAKLSVDVTKKPLILLVWGGLFVVLAGGIFATIYRIQEIRIRSRVGEIE